jgi:hypothetical protein
MKFPRSLILSLALLAPVAAFGETLLELDFQNRDGVETKARHQTGGASEIGELMNGAEIETGETGIEHGIEQIRKGSLVIDKQMTGAALMMKDQGGGGVSNNACFADYSRGAGFGTGTIVMVFKPSFATAGGRGNTLFCTNAVSTMPGFIALRMQGKKFIFLAGAKDDATMAQVETPGWEPGDWYFLAASWQEGANPTAYVRRIGSDDVFFSTGNKPVAAGKGIRHSVRIGNGHNVKDPNPDSMMDGRLAYFLWTDSFADSQSAYDALYSSIAK